MDKWIFVNNITSLDKLYILTKIISEKKVTIENHTKVLMDELNRNGAKRNEANSHPINYVLFYNMVYCNDGIYKTTDYGDFLVKNYKKIKDDKRECAEFFFNVLLEIKYPNIAVNTSKEYLLRPFEILFKLMLDDRLNKRITIDEISKYISIIKKEDDYENFVKLLLEHRKNNSPMPQCEEVAQMSTVVAGWINSFNVMKREGNSIMISNDLNLKLPKVKNNSEIKTLPFSQKFISYVLKKHLFDGLSRSDIDYSFYGTKKYNGMMSQLVIEFFGLNNDKGIYKGLKFDTVINFLKLQTDLKYKKLADMLSEEIDKETESHLEFFRNFFISNAEKVDPEEEGYIALENQFLKEYPLERILQFSIDEYKEYCYKLEFDKTTYKNIGFPIGAGGAYKYGFYQKKDDSTYRDGNDIIIPKEKANEYFNSYKTQLYNYLKEVEKSEDWIDPREKYNLLAKTNYSNVWLQKLICVYFPEKVINVYKKLVLIEFAGYLGIPLDYDWVPGKMSYEINKWLRKNVIEVKKYHPFYIGNAVYKLLDIDENEKENVVTKDISYDDFVKGGYNAIYYGIPGCGKSFEANREANKLTNSNQDLIIRTTFYPDYTNSDFIGQIIPKIDDNDKNNVLYDIQGGPFTDAMVLAYNNPSSNVCLIIEEINRGNAAAIFGDLFQLLDRKEDGNSVYYIENYTISKYLERECINKTYNYNKIRIPSNLYLIGTMNTSDQNVFTLDTAFKRRWEMRHIVNNVDKSEYADKIIPILNMSWKDFVKKINFQITHNEDDLGINGEDKQLGAYFISGIEWGKMDKLIQTNNSEEAARIFAEKVLSYIWEDVAKLNKDSLFKKDYRVFDDVVSDFLANVDVLDLDIDIEG